MDFLNGVDLKIDKIMHDKYKLNITKVMNISRLISVLCHFYIFFSFTVLVLFSTGCQKDAIPKVFPLPQPCHETPYVDYHGVRYPTIQIGNQCWLSKNLNVGVFTSGELTNNDTIEKLCYNNDTSNCAIYGGLYSWNEAMQYSIGDGNRGICPEGWHIPTKREFTELLLYTDFYSYYLMDTESGMWAEDEYENHHNATGFSALPGGIKFFDEFYLVNRRSEFLTSSHDGEYLFYYVMLFTNSNYSYILSNQRYTHLEYRDLDRVSVRCIKDNEKNRKNE